MSGAVHGLLASLAGRVKDTFFRYVSLLLNTTSTNGAQNNTFLDSSTNAFSITRNGNTTQGNFSPFSQTGWSNYFDGNGDYLSAAGNTAFDFGTGDFTVEAWVYLPATQTQFATIACQASTGNAWYLSFGTGNTVTFGNYATTYITSSSAVSNNTWSHVAVSRSGTSLKMFINGAEVGSATNSVSLGVTANLFVGFNNATHYFNGYLSNLRIVKGTAVYTSAFTPPTAPLTAITNTSLLTCQSNRFIDNSSNAFTITRNGDVAVQAFSPFSPTAAWSASTNGGSGYFDGTGDYLTAPSNAALSLSTSTVDFTIEAWVYPNSFGGAVTTIVALWPQTPTGRDQYIVAADTTGALGFYWAPFNTSLVFISGGILQRSTWSHVAVTRSGNTFRLFLNGSQVASGTSTVTAGSDDLTSVGRYGDGSTGASPTSYWNGYIANTRIVKGTAVYTANFTPPTAPLTAITNTSLLLNFTNAGIFDSASGNDLETVGNAQVSTVQAKWGTTSISCDGTGDYVVAPSTVRYGYGTGDFTIEFWLYLNTAAADQTLVSNLTSVSSTNPHIYLNGATGTIRYYTASADRITGSALSAGQWYHIAVSRASSNTRMFINGTQTGSTYADANNYGATAPIGVGTYWSAGSPVGTSTLNGYIDDLRITNGIARYTSNFTAPTAAFPLQ